MDAALIEWGKQVARMLAPCRSQMSTTAYDTAWVARLAGRGLDLAGPALEWLRRSQLPDGSWGALKPVYHHDRFICTLNAIVALAKYGDIGRNGVQMRSALEALNRHAPALVRDPAGATIGFEMIAPPLVDEAARLGIEIDLGRGNSLLEGMKRARELKLRALTGRKITREVTMAFSAEMAGNDGYALLDFGRMQERNGSVGHSPSATAYFLRLTEDPAALFYLRSVALQSGDGGVPTVAPSDVFEIGWVLWNLSLTPDWQSYWGDEMKPHLDWLEAIWSPGMGVPQAWGYTPHDSDDTGLVFSVLARAGRLQDVEALLHYEEDDYFRCFSLEANPSVSANIHVLGALLSYDGDDPRVERAVDKVLNFLFRSRTGRLFWFDKWHASPYYATAHCVVALAHSRNEMAEQLMEDAIAWVVGTQDKEGGWGFYHSTAEETAYALQALWAWQSRGEKVPRRVVERGRDWLERNARPPYPPLWIGKALYCPYLVVQSAIISALTLAF